VVSLGCCRVGFRVLTWLGLRSLTSMSISCRPASSLVIRVRMS
jgi:hypothetical protein